MAEKPWRAELRGVHWGERGLIWFANRSTEAEGKASHKPMLRRARGDRRPVPLEHPQQGREVEPAETIDAARPHLTLLAVAQLRRHMGRPPVAPADLRQIAPEKTTELPASLPQADTQRCSNIIGHDSQTQALDDSGNSKFSIEVKLLGICFWRKSREEPNFAGFIGEKGGCGGKRGRRRRFGVPAGGVLAKDPASRAMFDGSWEPLARIS